MKIGEKVMRCISEQVSSEPARSGDKDNAPREGTVVWIHPKGRFYLVEFPVERFGRIVGRIREAYLLPELRKRSKSA